MGMGPRSLMVHWQAGSAMGNGSSVINGPLTIRVCDGNGSSVTNGPLAGGVCDGEWVLCH